MNEQIEALKMAIAEIEGWIDHAYGYSPENCADNKAIQACKKALAQAEKQEPVAWIKDVDDKGIIDFAMITEESAYPVYRHPATWQSLSDDEIQALALDNDVISVISQVQQALKEKNHG